ncbi:MAG: polymerase subunit delta [Fimbriimonadaceae bacterium]|nr:polymerase subunit delta [Fimbriimonadaceae bacterium]
MKLDPEKALAATVILLSGEESALRRVALEKLLETAGVQADDFDLQNFEGDTDPQDWLAAAGTTPFLAERRVVIVRHVLRGDLDRAKAVSFKGLPDSALLLLIADEESGDDDRQRRLNTARKGWEKLISTAGGHVVLCTVPAGSAKGLVRAELTKSDLKITERALDVLSEMCAGNASRALEEVPKLVAFVGSEKTVQESHIREVVMPAREWNVFKLVDSVVEGDVAEGLRQLRILVGSPAKAEDAAFRNILPQLSRSLRLIWQARVCADAGVQPSSPAVQSAMLSKPNLATEQDFVKNKAMRAARRINLEQIAAMLQLVSDADSQLKGQLPSFSAMETLEQTVLKMAEVARPKVAVH